MYRINKIHDNVWVIGEDIRPDFTDSMVLVAGSESAALIDTGCGAGNLKETISKLTDLPVTVLTTHVHLDHIGGHAYFEDIYASEYEMQKWMEKGLWKTSVTDRLDFLKAAVEGNDEKFIQLKAEILEESHFIWKPLKDGMVFNLGGVVLEACMVPGHTRESFVFVNQSQGEAYVGDSINPTPWLLEDNGVSVKEYGRSVAGFADRYPLIKRLYSGHCMEDIGIQTIEDTLACVDEVLAGADDPEVSCYAGRAFRHICGSVVMFYKNSSIYGRGI